MSDKQTYLQAILAALRGPPHVDAEAGEPDILSREWTEDADTGERVTPGHVEVTAGEPDILTRQHPMTPEELAAPDVGAQQMPDDGQLHEAQPMDYAAADVRSQPMQALRAREEAEAAQRRKASSPGRLAAIFAALASPGQGAQP